jgi:hypothetical protein
LSCKDNHTKGTQEKIGSKKELMARSSNNATNICLVLNIGFAIVDPDPDQDQDAAQTVFRIKNGFLMTKKVFRIFKGLFSDSYLLWLNLSMFCGLQ